MRTTCKLCNKKLAQNDICYCQECRKHYNHRWYLKHRLEILKQSELKYKADPTKKREYSKLYRATPRGKSRKVYDNIKWRCINPKAHSYKRYGAKGIKVKISSERFIKLHLAATHCNICGCEFIHGDPHRCKTTDRINNDGHYEESNIQFLCNDCNGNKGAN